MPVCFLVNSIGDRDRSEYRRSRPIRGSDGDISDRLSKPLLGKKHLSRVKYVLKIHAHSIRERNIGSIR